MNRLKLTVLVSSTLFLVACGGGSDGDSSFIIDDGIPKNNIAAPVVKTQVYIDANTNANTVLDTVSANKTLMTYKMLGVNGAETQATALLFTPKGTKPTGGWPIVAWAHGRMGAWHYRCC